MVYNPYTSKDVKRLIEYLAENNRDGKARHGNKIYQQLVENQKKWPWSKNHSWQSWRDYYVKNEAELSKKIKKYQREHGILTKAQDSKNEDNKAMKTDAAEIRRRLAQEEEEGEEEPEPGSPVEKESVCSRKRVGETVRDPSPSDRKRQKVMKEGCKVRHPSASLPKEDSEPSLVGHPLAENEVEAESTHPVIEDTEDRQEVNQTLALDEQTGSAGASDKVLARQEVPSVTRRVSALARKVPVPSLSDDSLDSLFDADSDILVPDSDEGPNALLPGRAQNRDQDDFFQSSSDASSSTRSVDKRRSLPRTRHPPTFVEGPFKTTLTTKASQPGRVRQDANLESDAAEVTSPWPPIRTQSRTPRSVKNQAKKHGQVKYDGSDEAVMHHAIDVDADHWHENNHSHTASGTGRIDTPQHQSFKGVKIELSPTVDNGEHPVSLFSKSRTTRLAGSRIPMVEEICDDSGFGDGQLSTSTQNYLEQGTNEGSRAISQASQSGRYVDLHEEGKRRHSSRRPTDIPGSSRGTRASSILSTSYGRQSPISIQLSIQDQSLVTTLGIQQAVTMMSKNHGFTEDVVSRILQNVNSIPRADEILREMRVKAEEAALKHLMLDEPRRPSSKQKKHESSRASQKFEIRAMSDDEMSDYSPPSKTRAGQFSRLVEQGRHEEAYAREARRASGVGHASNNPNIENDTRSPSNKPRSRAEPKAVEDGVFFDNKVEEIGTEAVEETVEETVEDIADIRDAHAAMAPTFEHHESKLSPQRALQRFQQTAKIVKQILIDHQGHS